MTVAAQIEIHTDDLRLVARALCQADGDTGAPCTCRGDATICAALDVYGDQARKVLGALEAMGRLVGSPPALTPELVEGFFEANARRRGWLGKCFDPRSDGAAAAIQAFGFEVVALPAGVQLAPPPSPEGSPHDE